MKSRTSSYKMTWFQKNLTRFAPFWVLYTLCLLLGLAILSNERDPFYFIMNLAGCSRMMAVVNCGYALLTAQLLFGDLYNSRMCYGIHSLPVRREEIFAVNVAAGLLFSLAPTLLMTLCALPLAMTSTVPYGAAVPFLWFAASNLQYLFFFALAVFCVFCAGNRFSMVIIYGVLNFGSMLAYLMIESLYMPMMKGVFLSYEPFRLFSPVAEIASEPLMLVERMSWDKLGHYTIQSGSWIYLMTCAAVGILLLLAALQMYRKRSLEAAGEFTAFRFLKPVCAVGFSLLGGTGLNLAARIFYGYQQQNIIAVIFCFVGLIAGWFVGLMLLHKTARVFGRKSVIGVCTIILAVLASLLLTHMDPMHIISWVPESGKVEGVYMIPGYYNFGEYYQDRDKFLLSDPGELQKITQIHALAIEEGVSPEDVCWYYSDQTEDPSMPRRYTVPVSLEYHMKNGSLRRRSYYIYADGVAGELTEKLYSRAQVILEIPELLLEQQAASWININGLPLEEQELTSENTRELLRAMRQDMEEGNLAQFQEFHPIPVWADEFQEISCIYLGMGFGEEGIYLDVYSDSTHTMQWLRNHGLVEKVISRTVNPDTEMN